MQPVCWWAMVASIECGFLVVLVPVLLAAWRENRKLRSQLGGKDEKPI